MRNLLCLLVMLSFGCGDDASPADTGQRDSGTDVSVDVSVDTPLVPDAGAPDVPVDAGAAQTVTIRAVGGATAEGVLAGLDVYAGVGEALMVATTNAEGEATLDVTPGSAITVEYVGTEQTTYTSLVSFDENVPQVDGVFIMPILAPLADLDPVTLSGTVTNASAGTVAWVVTADAQRAATTTPSNSPDFTIQVPRQDGDITVYLGTGLPTADPRPSPRGFDRVFGPGASITVDASMDQSDLVIDAVEDGSVFEVISGSFAVPEGDALLDAAPANIDMRTNHLGGAIVGGVSRIFFDEEANLFRWEGARFPVATVADVALQQGPRASRVLLDTDGAGDLGELPFIPPPNITTPAFGETVSPGGEVVVDNTPANTYLSLFLVNGDATQWWVISGNESTVTIPVLPADSSVLVGDNVRFRPRYCTRQTGPTCPEVSFGPAVEAAP